MHPEGIDIEQIRSLTRQPVLASFEVPFEKGIGRYTFVYEIHHMYVNGKPHHSGLDVIQ
jgi:hypothetical protein